MVASTDREAVLGAWSAASSDLIMLPSGVEVRLDLPSVASLLVSGAMPSALRALAMQFVGDGVEPDALDPEEKKQWTDLEHLLVSESVVAIKPPGFDEPQPFRLTIEDLARDPMPVPRHDYLALRDIVLHIRTIKQVDALSRVAAMEVELEEARERGATDDEVAAMEARIAEKAQWAARVVESERVNSIEGWMPFRPEGGFAAAGADSEDMGHAPVQPADHLGRGGRPRARRSPRSKTDRASGRSAA